jgi:transcriptional regulator with XRE-family HTH domain
MGKTPLRVINLLKEEIPDKISLNQFCKQTGINPNSVDKYLSGNTEPNMASLDKLSSYFKVPVPWLQGHWPEMSAEGAKKYYASLSEKSSGWVDVEKMKAEIAELFDDANNPRIKFKSLINEFLAIPIEDREKAIDCLVEVSLDYEKDK